MSAEAPNSFVPRLLLSVALVALGCSGSKPEAIRAPLTGPAVDVLTDKGPVTGAEEDGLHLFLGIPYTAPPLGALRFSAPVPHEPWTEPRSARQFAPPCPQPRNASGKGGVKGDEDCLYLNIWTHPGAESLPVMVFIHGGAGFLGETSSLLTDGANLARRTGHVVVSLSYRLGALGFLALPELRDEGFRSAGNQNLLDQQAALRWIQSNIAAFGGDPGRVMLFGESEGAFFACVHAVSPASEGLFHGVISESGNCSEIPEQAETFEKWEEFAEKLGCDEEDRLECLRRLPAEKLVAGIPPLIESVVDGSVLPEQPRVTWQRGGRAELPIVIGTNRDEATLFSAPSLEALGGEAFVNSRWGYTVSLQSLFGNFADDLERLYPYDRYQGGLEALNIVATDVHWACPAREWARAWTRGGGVAWQYEFTAALRGEHGRKYGATHGLELLFVFKSFTAFEEVFSDEYSFNAEEHALADWMQDRWGEFAATGSMEGAGWPTVSLTDTQHLEISLDPSVRSTFREGRCEALLQLGIVERL